MYLDHLIDDTSYLTVNWQDPVDHAQEINKGLGVWYLCVPHWLGGSTWRDLLGVNHATLQNMEANTDWVNSKDRPNGWCALDFGGTNEYADTADSPALSPTARFTVCCWFRTATNYAGAADVAVVIKGPFASDYDWMMYLQDGALNIFFKDSGGTGRNVGHTVTYSDDVWHHMVGTYDGATLRLYWDGVEVGTPVSVATDVRDGTDSLMIGRGWGSYFTGQVDDVRVWHRALSAKEIAAIYNQPVGVSLRRWTKTSYFFAPAAVAAGQPTHRRWEQTPGMALPGSGRQSAGAI